MSDYLTFAQAARRLRKGAALGKQYVEGETIWFVDAGVVTEKMATRLREKLDLVASQDCLFGGDDGSQTWHLPAQ